MRIDRENSDKEDIQAPFLLVPRKWLEDISKSQDRILNILVGGEAKATVSGKPKADLGDYISETDARELLGRKSGWFWKLRSSGQLPFLKWGRGIFYKRSDIIRFLDQDYKERNG